MFMQESGRDFHGGVGYAAEQRDASEGEEGQGGESSEGSQAEASENEDHREGYLERQDRHEDEAGEELHLGSHRPVSEGTRASDAAGSGHTFGIFVTAGSACSNALPVDTNGSLGPSYSGPSLLRQLREHPQASSPISLHDSLRGSGESESNFTSLLTSGGPGECRKGQDARSSMDGPASLRKPRLLELDSMETVEPSLKYVLSDPAS